MENAIGNDPMVKCDALFVHGSPVRDDTLDKRLLQVAVECYCSGLPMVVLNGLTREQCREKNLAYDGYEAWQDFLERSRVPKSDIVILPASPHTAAESRNFLALAKKEGWTRLTIASYPHHIVRCFQQIVALMPEAGFEPQVHALTFHNLGWGEVMKKPVMGGQTALGGKDVEGTLEEHISEEYVRQVAYAQEPPLKDGKPTYTRHATFPEVIAYLNRREKIGQ